jgi:uncharacterized protein
MASKKVSIAGQKVKLGEIKDIQVPFSESYLGKTAVVPVRVIRASKSGPTVFITGAIHGDEITGIGIIRELLFNYPLVLDRGTLICIPAVNIFGLESNSRYLPDRRDLNRCFPGYKTGSLTGRLAHTVFTEIIELCDYGIDFHSAAIRRVNYPNVRADMKHPEVKKLAKAFGCELIVNTKGPRGSLRREAVKHNIPTIILEAGEVWKFVPEIIRIGVDGCINVLKYLGMVKGEPEPPRYQVTIEKTTWVRAERGGFMEFHAHPGDFVDEGQELATNYGIFGLEKNIIKAPTRGVILGMTTMPAVQPGAPVYHLAKLSDFTFKRIRKKLSLHPRL